MSTVTRLSEAPGGRAISRRNLLRSVLAIGAIAGSGFAMPPRSYAAEAIVLDVVKAEVVIDRPTGDVMMLMMLAPSSAQRVADLTRSNIDRIVEVRIDGKPITRPVILEAIENGKLQISLDLVGADRANELAAHLNSGAAKVEIELV